VPVTQLGEQSIDATRADLLPSSAASPVPAPFGWGGGKGWAVGKGKETWARAL